MVQKMASDRALFWVLLTWQKMKALTVLLIKIHAKLWALAKLIVALENTTVTLWNHDSEFHDNCTIKIFCYIGYLIILSILWLSNMYVLPKMFKLQYINIFTLCSHKSLYLQYYYSWLGSNSDRHLLLLCKCSNYTQ